MENDSSVRASGSRAIAIVPGAETSSLRRSRSDSSIVRTVAPRAANSAARPPRRSDTRTVSTSHSCRIASSRSRSPSKSTKPLSRPAATARMRLTRGLDAERIGSMVDGEAGKRR